MSDDTTKTSQSSTPDTSPSHAAPENSTSASGTVAGNTAVTGEHDRVQLLSLHADGTINQRNPELIGDPDATLAATKEQFRQQAVSAADVIARAPEAQIEDPDAVEDPTIAALRETHEEAESAADSAAEQTVKGLTS